MNLTAALNSACDELNRNRRFRGVLVVHADTQSEQGKRADCLADERSPEYVERYVNDYACARFCLDTYVSEPENEYEETRINTEKLDKDFRKWLLTFLGGDESLLPEKINLDGRDTEFYRRKEI